MSATDTQHDVIIGLGSNMGDRQDFITRAIAAMSEYLDIKRLSSIYETEPVGFADQNDFLNAALYARTTLSPAQLIARLLESEASLGRERKEKWGPRAIDLDVIFYDDMVVNRPELTLPHPFYAERNFVLAPLCEIYPDWTCPVRKMAVGELFRRSRDAHRVRKISTSAIMNLSPS